MAQNRFASVPNISIPRSRFKQPFNHSTSWKHGKLIPIDCFDILPGDTYKLDLSSLIWMSNPIRPLFSNITAHIDVFFVPMRLVWSSTKEFFGENKTSSGYQSTIYKIPSIRLGSKGYTGQYVTGGSLSHYLGKPITPSNGITSNRTVPVSILKERAYFEIWNNFYRSEQLQNPAIITYTGNGTYSDGTGGYIGVYGGQNIKLSDEPLSVNKEFDYFTAATISPQYGPAVSLPLGTYAPVLGAGDHSNLTLDSSSPIHWKIKNGVSNYSEPGVGESYYLGFGNSGTYKGTLGMSYDNVGEVDFISAGGAVYPSNLVADLSQATAATINQLRYAFAVQKYLERSNFGSRFFEMLAVHYGVTSPDASLQIPQRLGHADIPVNVSTVLSTAGAAADSSSALGMPGAASCTASKKYMFTHAFTEPGFLMVLLNTTIERSYTQGILREDMKLDRYEIYSPEFANLGDQEVLNSEIYYADDANNGDVFGYQEHWAEYRYRPHRVSGLLDPQAANALDFWVTTDDYSTRPHLDGSWIVEDRDWVARCLTSGSSGPDYIGDFYFDYTATREMPLFTIPGLIDHFGVR